ncbi:hypothetical protein QCA50_005661 [Cerrena zonata]|uniref:Uncharacterized protein n=1 Tax=Cerrena zonata TaxID=2478898 RepID=A0AAW0GAA7_9APHY
MPEGNEAESMGQQTKNFREEHRTEDSWKVKALHADATTKERASARKGTRVYADLSQNLTLPVPSNVAM